MNVFDVQAEPSNTQTQNPRFKNDSHDTITEAGTNHTAIREFSANCFNTNICLVLQENQGHHGEGLWEKRTSEAPEAFFGHDCLHTANTWHFRYFGEAF